MSSLMGVFSLFCGCLEKRQKQGDSSVANNQDGDEGRGDYSELFFELRTLQIATNFFSDLNQLGHGGFGPVYKGLMPNGQEIAVKKLSLYSRQGVREFTNEVKVLLKIQHKNLVTLLGCCTEGPEKMLVYEFLPNRSLDYFLFDERKSAALEWPKRFQIIVGIARGLLYLHEEAPIKIIHRDIKASNILLDDFMNPKISDFGLARLFPEDETHLHTMRISGTRGYMSPEYATHGYLSVKTDVFSFGVLILEIVSGRKNQDQPVSGQKIELLAFAWLLHQEGRSLDLVDPKLAKYNHNEAAMCIQLGLLCCQASFHARPDMNSIHLMLSSDSFNLPRPGRPGLQGRRGRWSTSTSALTNTKGSSSQSTSNAKDSVGSSVVEEYSKNSISVSSLDEGR